MATRKKSAAKAEPEGESAVDRAKRNVKKSEARLRDAEKELKAAEKAEGKGK